MPSCCAIYSNRSFYQLPELSVFLNTTPSRIGHPQPMIRSAVKVCAVPLLGATGKVDNLTGASCCISQSETRRIGYPLSALWHIVSEQDKL